MSSDVNGDEKSTKNRKEIEFIGINGCKNCFIINEDEPSFANKEEKCKTTLYKTELCHNWLKTLSCRYGNKCHFSHGHSELRPKRRIENYKSRPCVDCAHPDAKCAFDRRCNFAHPGEFLRHICKQPYYDEDYYEGLFKSYRSSRDQLGVYL